MKFLGLLTFAVISTPLQAIQSSESFRGSPGGTNLVARANPVANAATSAPIAIPEAPLAAKPDILVRPNKFIEWSFEDHNQPTRYRMGGITVVVTGISDVQQPTVIRPRLAIQSPGLPVKIVEHERIGAYQPLRFGWGQLDRTGRWFLLLAGNDGRSQHCCEVLQAAVGYPDGIKIIDLREGDGGFAAKFPNDYDGDGIVDFIFQDDAFLYAFSTYAESWSPPVVMNIINGKAVDVSAQPRYRELFIRDMRKARRKCLRARGGNPDGACAGYAASAARAGLFDTAWQEIVQRRGPISNWRLPLPCLESRVLLGCPSAYQDGANDYLSALRSELKRLGYISG